MLSTTILSFPNAFASSRQSGTASGAQNGKQPETRSYRILTIPLAILAAFLFIIASLIFAFSIVVLTRLSVQLTDLHLVALYLNSSVYLGIALSSLVGFYYFFPFPRDQKVPKVERLNLSFSIYASLLVLSLGTSILCVYFLFQRDPPALLSDGQAAALTLNRTTSSALEQGVGMCIPENLAKMHDAILVNLCRRPKSLKTLSVILIVVGWLINLGAYTYSYLGCYMVLTTHSGEVILVHVYSRRVGEKIKDFEKNPFDDDSLNWY